MNKQERLDQVTTMKEQWLFKRIALGVLAGLSIYLLLQKVVPVGVGVMAIGITLFLLHHYLMQEAHVLKELTENERVKRIVLLQYRLDTLFIVLIALLFPLTMRFMPGSWSTQMLYIGAGVYILWTQRRLDGQLRQLDEHQPTRREIQRNRFSF